MAIDPNTGLPTDIGIAGYDTAVGDVGSVAGSTAASGRGVITESLNDRANALALAAGAQPGESAIVDGVKRTVSSASAAPTPPKRTDNKRLDDHPETGDGYLIQMLTDAVGNFFGKSLDRTALLHTKGTVTADGNYSSRITDSKGDTNEAHHGGKKTKVAHETKTNAGHSDTGTAGGVSSSVGKGKKTQNNGPDTRSTNGVKAETTAQSVKTFAQGGNGPQRVKGDYSLSSEEGGLHYEAAKDYTVSAKTNISLAADSGEVSVNAKGGNIGVSAQAGVITLNSDVKIIFKVGSSTITMLPDSITIVADKIDLNP